MKQASKTTKVSASSLGATKQSKMNEIKQAISLFKMGVMIF